MLECNGDDMSPELYPQLLDRLPVAGAKDAWVEPLVMKKERPGILVCVLCEGRDEQSMTRLLFAETITPGIRRSGLSSIALERTGRNLQTPCGPASVKVTLQPDGSRRVKPEHEARRIIALERGLRCARCAAGSRGSWRTKKMENEIYERLLERLRELKVAAVGFSGGADSTLLLAAARDALGDRVLALTAVTPYMERQEVADTLTLSSHLGVRHELVELDMPAGIEANPPERCYVCKRALYVKLLEVAREAGFPHVLDGSNLDDLADYRPGLRALRELEVRSPLLDCKLCKADVRRLSESLGLSTWNKPTNACLLTRLPIGTRVSMETLQRVEEAERFLKARGYAWVRVRVHGELARIEVAPEQRLQLLKEAETVVRTLEGLGFRHVTMELLGYRLGSMNPTGVRGERLMDQAPDQVGDAESERPPAGVKVKAP